MCVMAGVALHFHVLINFQALFKDILKKKFPDVHIDEAVVDAFVKNAGCQNSTDTLQCLRQASFASIKQAIDASDSFFSPSVS